MDKSRQQFEYWYFNNHNHEPRYPLRKDDRGYYYHDGTRKAWVAWQASRESLVVKLPYINTDLDYSDPYIDGKDEGILEVAAILNELGVTVE